MYIELVPFYQHLPPWLHSLPVEHCLYDTFLPRCSCQLIGFLILDKSFHHSFPRIPILDQTKKLHPLLLHTRKQLTAGENQTTAHTGTMCVVSSLHWALSAGRRFFSWSTPFSLLFIICKHRTFLPTKSHSTGWSSNTFLLFFLLL